MKKSILILLGISLVTLNLSAKTGEELFSKCIACHGSTANKMALNKSEIINTWDSKKIEKSLLGYKNGSLNVYGMGVLMKGQVKSLTDDDIKTLSEYVSKLNK